MKGNTDLLVEVWDSIKPFIEKHDRISVADNLVGIFDSNGLLDDVNDHQLDKELRAAVKSRFVDYDVDEESDDDSRDE